MMSLDDSVKETISRLESMPREERDEALKMRTHIDFDEMLDELFFERRAYVLANVETEEEIDKYIVEVSKKAKAKYDDMNKKEMNEELVDRSMAMLIKAKQAAEELDDEE